MVVRNKKKMKEWKAYNEFAGSISASFRLGNTARFDEMSQWWRAVGNAMSDLIYLRFEVQTYRCRDERVTARPTNCTVTH